MSRLLVFLLAFTAPVSAQTVDTRDIAVLELVAETPADEIYVDEQIMLTIRGRYGVQINREEVLQPNLRNFAWTQMGHDYWYDAVYEGRQLRGFDRRMALFPLRPGRMEIPGFTHHLKIMTRDGRREVREVKAPPLILNVLPRQGRADRWWLPARQVEVTEEWDRPPDTLAFGETLIRTITLTAHGAMPEMLPPPPEYEALGAHIFRHPEHREQSLGQNGPVSTVSWAFSISLLRPEPSTLPELELEWFNTRTRQMEIITLPARRVSPPAHARSDWMARHASVMAPLGLALGLLVGALALFGRVLIGGLLKILTIWSGSDRRAPR